MRSTIIGISMFSPKWKVQSRKEFGFAPNFEAGESWCGCGCGRLSNQIAGKVTAVCIWILYSIRYVANHGLSQDVEHLILSIRTCVCDSLALIISSVPPSHHASQLKRPFRARLQ